jgi:ATP-dependent helicase/nuclease subunit B
MPSSKTSATNYQACLKQAVEFLRKHSTNSEVLVVGATTEAAAEVVRLACDDAVIGAHAISLRNLARVLAELRLCAFGLTELSAIGREALIAGITPKAKLGYLAPISSSPGFARALSRTLRELRMENVKPDGDLDTLLTLYEKALQDGSYADVATVFRFATQVIHGRAHPFCGIPVVFLDVPAQHVVERQLVDALASAAADALTLTLDGQFNPPEATIFSASSESLECVEIARRAVDLASSGIAFDDMAVLARDAARMQPLLEEAFTRAGIPAFFSRGCVRPSSAGRALLLLLQCAAEGLPATRFLEYLSLAQAPSVRSHGWERLIVNASVVGGLSRWRRRLEALRINPDNKPERVKQIEELENFALPLLEKLSVLPTQATWGEWLEHIADLAESFIRTPQKLLEFFDELTPLSLIGPVDLQEIITLLDQHLRTFRETSDGARYGKVFIGAIEDARGMSFHCVFLPGLCEGVFPRPLREDPLLLNEERERYGIPKIDEDQERELLKQAAACASGRLIASYSRIDLATGRARVPSLYAYDVLRAARGHAFDPGELQKHAESNVETTLAWPAPHDLTNAIDDTEYDLALLRAPFESHIAVEGAAAYLATINPLTLDVLRNRWRRWHTWWHATDGIFEEIEAQLALKDRQLTERAYSPTALQQFAICPYRFYLDSIVTLKPLAEAAAAQRMDPRTRGSIFHRVQERIMRELTFPTDDLNAAYAALDEATREIAADEAAVNPPAIPRVWQQELNRLHADLRGWLAEYVRIARDWHPVAIEHRFETTVFDRYKILGAIDVVEQHTSGLRRVVDHKTGAPPRDKPHYLGKGEVLQPVLYALAAEQELGKPVPTGRLYYATLRGNYQTIDISVNDGARQQIQNLLTQIDDAIDHGEFHTCPRTDACQFCDYTPICGPYEEERARRKPKLHQLEIIRRTV